ncbi:peptidoglycan-binding protein [Pedobacter yulinensis]|uniref:Peptidoglycan-binding protein n=1 Tax=Pedobacter yulinensis TaxID=2126353 RepID=A0A2T3HLG7_9SPHI|nr:LysM peptidoglycan-binding domain-containing protein [Pedobacter yulinensis]PST83292.1 peptidoglycan-binding protein [Pedobacter yulinensis]
MYKFLVTVALPLFFAAKSNAAVVPDSISVENNNGKRVVVHKVDAKDTYYSIGRRYNVAPKDIMSFNKNKFLSIGVIIKVPTQIDFTSAQPTNPQYQTEQRAQAAQQQKEAAQAQPAQSVPETGLVEHVVQRKENLNLLAQRYGTTVNEIKRVNNLRTINLSIGQVLRIPSNQGTLAGSTENTQQETNQRVVQDTRTAPEKPAVQPPVTATPRSSQPAPAGKTYEVDASAKTATPGYVEHTVASNETIYSISVKHGVTMDEIKRKNNLGNNALTTGQKLLIKGEYPPKPVAGAEETPANGDTLKDPSLRYPASRYGLNQVEEKGTAVFITDPELDASKMLVLHRTAPIGTVIKVTNPMTNRTTFAKVVGKFTENETTKDVIIVMTKAVADSLGALDKRFFCNLSYGVQENEQ